MGDIGRMALADTGQFAHFYWLFTSKGRVFTKGDAGNFGGMGHPDCIENRRAERWGPWNAWGHNYHD